MQPVAVLTVFLLSMTQSDNAIFIARLGGNRVLQRTYTGEKNGRPIIFDKDHTFNLKDEETWSCTSTMILMYLDNPKRKKEHIIHIEVWYGFRMCGHYDAKIQETPLMVGHITVREQTPLDSNC